MKINRLTLTGLFILCAGSACVKAEPPRQESSQRKIPVASRATEFFFDDFTYTDTNQFEANGWIIRTEKGWPGITGASWEKTNVTFHADPDLAGNNILRMTSTIGQEASQTQICYKRKFLEGTYAARVRFTNRSAGGPNGDEVVMSFYAVTPYEKALDPAYSEMDFEYLPNGGWNLPPRTIGVTTWETAQIEPWIAENDRYDEMKDCQGWHVLVIQAVNGQTRYYIDDTPYATHKDPYYPDSRMSINFNLWFINGGNLDTTEPRNYIEEIDWVFHARNLQMSSQDVTAQVQALRTSGQAFHDTVPAGNPVLDCRCDM